MAFSAIGKKIDDDTFDSVDEFVEAINTLFVAVEHAYPDTSQVDVG